MPPNLQKGIAMKDKFDRLRDLIRNESTPEGECESVVLMIDIAEQVVADLHRIADALEVRNLQCGGGASGLLPGTVTGIGGVSPTTGGNAASGGAWRG
jgi:hypothetical protein